MPPLSHHVGCVTVCVLFVGRSPVRTLYSSSSQARGSLAWTNSALCVDLSLAAVCLAAEGCAKNPNKSRFRLPATPASFDQGINHVGVSVTTSSCRISYSDHVSLQMSPKKIHLQASEGPRRPTQQQERRAAVATYVCSAASFTE